MAAYFPICPQPISVARLRSSSIIAVGLNCKALQFDLAGLNAQILSCVEISLLRLDETFISSAENNPSHNYRVGDKPAKHEV